MPEKLISPKLRTPRAAAIAGIVFSLLLSVDSRTEHRDAADRPAREPWERLLTHE
jgi:hypothetical protein